MVECRFFLQGRCNQGDTCRFEHPKPSSSKDSWRDTTPRTGGAESSDPQLNRNPSTCAFFRRGVCRYVENCKQSHDLDGAVTTPPPATADARQNVVCRFFLRNACSKGDDCPFQHAVESPEISMITPHPTAADSGDYEQRRQMKTLSEPTTALSDRTSASQDIAGASVTFAEGAAVSKIALPADFSTVLVSNVPAVASQEDVRNALKSWVPHKGLDICAWKIDPLTLLRSAEVKVADGGRLCRDDLSEKSKLKIHGADLHISPINLAITEAGTSRLQLANVSCTWHNPSTIADLRYPTKERAVRALSALQKRTSELHGRQLTFEHAQKPPKIRYHRWHGNSSRVRETIYTVHVLNLDGDTSEDDLRQFLKHYAPVEIVLKPGSHSMSKHYLQQEVKTRLQSYGNLLEWTVSPLPGVAKVKAYAKFVSYDEAANATKALNGCRIDSLSKDVLHVQHVVSVKLPVSQRVLAAIKPQLCTLAQTSQSESHVTVKAYENLHKVYTQIRVSGAEKTSVARVKMQVEVLLAGNIAQDGTQPLTRPFFFQATAISFLQKLMDEHKVIVLQDKRKMVLRMYGDTDCVKAAQQALQAKATQIDRQTKEVILDSYTFATAMRGGFQRVVAALGKGKVKLDISSNPKRILVHGSDDDEKLANCILHSSHVSLADTIADMTINDEEDSLCAVCWTPAEDPMMTTCGHSYCKDCLDSQAASTSQFPIRCLGDSGRCNTAFTLPELQRILTHSTYDELLESSLVTYIRSHSKAFTYCSTPDCNRFYRISEENNAIVFNCDHCLASICTACHTAAHDHGTCAEAKAGRDGTDEFAEWKKSNDVRDCPDCDTPIQKSEGCNHMECRSCHAHICWHCMKVFKDGGDVYEHMTKDHQGDWGLGWRHQDFQ